MPKKPFLLVSSNMNCNNMLEFHENINLHRNAGYFKRDPDLFKNLFYKRAEDYRKLYSFIDAIKFLANNNDKFDIVLRPHPTENIKAWEIFLENVPNVHVIRQDSITAWVKNSFAVMHNGCTTAIEATISGKPVITYSPFKMEYAHELSNKLGHKVESKEELLIKANEIFYSKNNENQKNKKVEFFDPISNKLFIDKNEIAAKKILKVWESFDDTIYSQPINWRKFYWFKIKNFKRYIRNVAINLFPNKIKANKENYKFPPLDSKDINSRVNRLQKILGIKETIHCKLLSERTILIKKM